MPVLWTASPFILAGAIALAWLVARIRATGIRPGRGLAALLSGRPKAERTLLVLVLVAAWVAGGTKPGGGGGANNVPNVANERVLPITSASAQLEGSPQLSNGDIGTGNNSTMATLIATTNTARVLDADDFARGDANVLDSTAGNTRTIACSDNRGRTLTIQSIENGIEITITGTASGSLEHTWRIVNVGGSTSNIRLTKISRLDNVMSDRSYTCADGGWTCFDIISQTSEELVKSEDLNGEGVKREERIVRSCGRAERQQAMAMASLAYVSCWLSTPSQVKAALSRFARQRKWITEE